MKRLLVALLLAGCGTGSGDNGSSLPPDGTRRTVLLTVVESADIQRDCYNPKYEVDGCTERRDGECWVFLRAGLQLDDYPHRSTRSWEYVAGHELRECLKGRFHAFRAAAP